MTSSKLIEYSNIEFGLLNNKLHYDLGYFWPNDATNIFKIEKVFHKTFDNT